MPSDSHRRRHLVALAKISLAAVILTFLFVRLGKQDAFTRLIDQPKQWGVLLAAQAMVLAAFAISCVRWFILVRALEIDFPLRDAFRLGSLGFMLSQVSLGSIGGDLFKAVFIAREQPERKTHAVASVVIDRAVGLYAMLLVASGSLVVGGGLDVSSDALRTLAILVLVGLAVGTVCLIVVLSPAASGARVKRRAESLPVVGETLGRLVDAAAFYRNRRGALYAAIMLGVSTHCLLISGIYSISQALPIVAPDLSEMVLIAPLSLFVGAVPATPGGLGTFEAAMEILFKLVGCADGDGTLAALTYRAATYVVASIGAAYYITSRRRISEAIHDAEELTDEQGEPVSGELL